jgi:hypothetical protein
MSKSPNSSASTSIPSAAERSAAIPRTSAFATWERSRSEAAKTLSGVRPSMRTDAPSRASAAAVEKPIPLVGPVISARLRFN